MEGSKLRLTCGSLDNRPFGRLGFVNLDGPNYAIWTKEPFLRNSMAAEVKIGKYIYITKKCQIRFVLLQALNISNGLFLC